MKTLICMLLTLADILLINLYYLNQSDLHYIGMIGFLWLGWVFASYYGSFL